MNVDLRGKVAIVTGAGRGIGEVIATTLMEEGSHVVLVERDAELLERVHAAAVKAGYTPTAARCDVATKSDVARMTEVALKHNGRIDILVNNAGVAPMGVVETFEEAAWDASMDVNAKGVFLCCQAVLPTMKLQRAGRIINAASFAAIVPSVGSAAYAASKAAVVSFTRVLAGELGPWNVTVNAYAPGMIPTLMNRFAEAAPAQQARLLDTLTLRRWGIPQDVANLVVFLASDKASYITGTLVDVSGGKLAVQMPQVAHERAAQEGIKT
jgi:3-oxoacyl-[acyl-carrier protein] reductase